MGEGVCKHGCRGGAGGGWGREQNTGQIQTHQSKLTGLIKDFNCRCGKRPQIDALWINEGACRVLAAWPTSSTNCYKVDALELGLSCGVHCPCCLYSLNNKTVAFCQYLELEPCPCHTVIKACHLVAHQHLHHLGHLLTSSSICRRPHSVCAHGRGGGGTDRSNRRAHNTGQAQLEIGWHVWPCSGVLARGSRSDTEKWAKSQSNLMPLNAQPSKTKPGCVCLCQPPSCKQAW